MFTSRLSLSLAALSLGILFAGGISTGHAQQAGATDPTLFNTGGPGTTNDTRPTLVLPQRPSATAAAHPGDGAAVSGWSPVGGPYTNSRGRALTSNAATDQAASNRLAQR
jgi:hypothetical protein